ncbi:MAG TPA: hypothetical protein VIN07_12630 [Flavipsychrobacter sp.]
MNEEQINSIKQILLDKGVNENDAQEIIQKIPSQQQLIVQTKASDPTENIITLLLENEAVQKAIVNFSESQTKITELENTREEKLHEFLRKLDVRQKIYNVVFLFAGCGLVLLLKANDVIGQDAAQTLVTVIISLSVTDAINSFLKSKKD